MMHALLSQYDPDLLGLSRPPNLFRDLDRLFGEADPWLRRATSKRAPAMKFEETNEGYRLLVEMPGLADKDVSLKFDQGVLTVEGRREVIAPEGYRPTHRERHSFGFHKAFRLGSEVDPERITARMKDGVLSVDMPKRSRPQPLHIPVHAA